MFIYHKINSSESINERAALKLLFAITSKSNEEELKAVMKNEQFNAKLFSLINSEFCSSLSSKLLHKWASKMLICSHQIEFINTIKLLLQRESNIDEYSPQFITAACSLNEKEISEMINEENIQIVIQYILGIVLRNQAMIGNFTDFIISVINISVTENAMLVDAFKSSITNLLFMVSKEEQTLLINQLKELQINILSDKRIARSFMRIEAALKLFSDVISYTSEVSNIMNESNKMIRIIKIIDFYQNVHEYMMHRTKESLIKHIKALYKEAGLTEDDLYLSDAKKQVIIIIPCLCEEEETILIANDSPRLDKLLQNSFKLQISRNNNGKTAALKQKIISIQPISKYGIKVQNIENSSVFVDYNTTADFNLAKVEINESKRQTVSNVDEIINAIKESKNAFIKCANEDSCKAMKELHDFIEPHHCLTLFKTCRNMLKTIDEEKENELKESLNEFYFECMSKLRELSNNEEINNTVNETILSLCEVQF